MKTKPDKHSTQSLKETIVTFLIIVTGSILFCSKGVVAKLLYIEGLDAIAVLNLRMTLSFPFFAGIVFWQAGGLPSYPIRVWMRFLFLGMMGYYFSSLVNFTGLQYISVGLERIILYTYPSLVLLITFFFLKKKVSLITWVCAFIAWGGIAIAFKGEITNAIPSANLPLGALLVFASALSYAVFVVVSGATISQYGPLLFSGIAGGISCLLMMVHFSFGHGLIPVFQYSTKVYVYGLILSIFGTVIPIFLMGMGIQRAGPQRFAVMGAIGPIATVLLAWRFLGEVPHIYQWIGLMLAIVGGLGVNLKLGFPVLKELIRRKLNIRRTIA